MGNVEPTDNNNPIQHADEHLVVYIPVISQELQSVQFGVVARGIRDRLLFYLALFLILYSPNSFLDILLASDGVSSFVIFVIFFKVLIWRSFSLNVILLLDEFHDILWCFRGYHKIVHIRTDVLIVITRLSHLDPNVSVKYSGSESDVS